MSDNHAYLALIQALDALPSIGEKAAERLATHLVLHKDAALYQALAYAQQQLQPCTRCRVIGAQAYCALCQDSLRENRILVLKSMQQQKIAEEKGWKGRYFILHSYLSPAQGVGPKQLDLERLLNQALSAQAEVVLALEASAEARATSEFIWQMLKLKQGTVVQQEWSQWLAHYE
ncbi:MAG: hypothetical protein RL217_654 [Pseudomonadota bacterium]|jgi:recombination protein RecR